MHRFAAVSIVCSALLAAGCVDPRGPVALPGAWQLVRINSDEGAPWAFGDTAMLYADALVIDPNGSFKHHRVTALDVHPEIAIIDACPGAWAFESQQIVFTMSDWCAVESFTVTWRGGATLVRDRQGHHWVYRKVGR